MRRVGPLALLVLFLGFGCSDDPIEIGEAVVQPVASGGVVAPPPDMSPTPMMDPNNPIAADAGTGPTPMPTGGTSNTGGETPPTGGPATVEPIEFSVSGTTVRGHHYAPAGAGDADPVIVMAHGLGATAAMVLPEFAQRFSDAGIHVVLFDYRNFGESDTAPNNPWQLVSTAMQLEDWRAAIAYARTLPGIDATKTILWGSSLSGGHVLSLGGEDDSLAAVLAQVPHVSAASSSFAVALPTSLTLFDLANQDAALPPGAEPITVPFVGPPGTVAIMNQPGSEEGYLRLVPPGAKWANETPARFIHDFMAYSPDATAGASTVPTLIIIAKDDVVTPPDAARQLATNMGATLVEVEGGHFDPYFDERFEEVLAAQFARLEQLGLLP